LLEDEKIFRDLPLSLYSYFIVFEIITWAPKIESVLAVDGAITTELRLNRCSFLSMLLICVCSGNLCTFGKNKTPLPTPMVVNVKILDTYGSARGAMLTLYGTPL
jgi:hypothetical protein